MKKPRKEKVDNSIRITASQMYDEYGIECLNISNFLHLFYIKGLQNGNPVTERTLKGYIPYINKLIENEWKSDINEMSENDVDDIVFETGNAINEIIKIEKEKQELIPDYIIVKIGDIERKYILEKCDKNNPPEEIDLPQLPKKEFYDGLFDYTNPKAIKIRRGKYKGTNIGSRKSVLDNFGNIAWFYKWCLGQIERGKLLNYNDTEKNMKTLADIIKWIDNKMTY